MFGRVARKGKRVRFGEQFSCLSLRIERKQLVAEKSEEIRIKVLRIQLSVISGIVL